MAPEGSGPAGRSTEGTTPERLTDVLQVSMHTPRLGAPRAELRHPLWGGYFGVETRSGRPRRSEPQHSRRIVAAHNGGGSTRPMTTRARRLGWLWHSLGLLADRGCESHLVSMTASHSTLLWAAQCEPPNHSDSLARFQAKQFVRLFRAETEPSCGVARSIGHYGAWAAEAVVTIQDSTSICVG